MQHHNANLADSQFIRLSNTLAEFGQHPENDGLPVLLIDAPFARASVLLQGAQLLEFQPAGEHPWLWLSPFAQFRAGASPRGGIPVCLPWFGVNRHHPDKPKHGFARNRDWQLLRWQESPASIKLEFGFCYEGDEPALFATPFSASLTIVLSAQLDLSLHIHNTASCAQEFSWALHSYFAVDDCSHSTVSGLDGLTYLDNTQGLQAQQQQGPVQFLAEIDRVYTRTLAAQQIHAGHTLAINGEHCPTCIVWNAGATAAANMADIGAAYRQYICVERGCAFADSLILPAATGFSSTMSIIRQA